MGRSEGVKIEIDGTFHDYCSGCPYIELVTQARMSDGQVIYACEKVGLCVRLWDRLSTMTKGGK